MKLWAITGHAGAGKDEIAGLLQKNYDFQRVAFADPVRASALAINPQVWTLSSGIQRLSFYVEKYGWDYCKREIPECRRILQVIGTEMGRQIFGEDCWINVAWNECQKHKDKNIVISDCRFPNEAEWVKECGGVIIKVIRPIDNGVGTAHASEAHINNLPFDFLIDNNGCLEKLYAKVHELFRFIEQNGIKKAS